MQVIIYNQGSDVYLIPVENGLSVEQVASSVPSGVSYDVVDSATLPVDRTFRKALIIDNGAVSVDMVKACDIHMDRLREMRQEKFVEMGFPQKLNEEVENAVVSAPVKAQLQALRDIPQTYDLSVATTPEALKAMIPVELGDL